MQKKQLHHFKRWKPRQKTVTASRHRTPPSIVFSENHVSFPLREISDLKFQRCRGHGLTIPNPHSLPCHVHPLVLVPVVPAAWDYEKPCGALLQRWNVENGDDRRPHPTHVWRWGEGKLKLHGRNSWRLCNLAAMKNIEKSESKGWKTPSIFQNINFSRWWQLNYFLFSTRSLGKWSNLTI